jgi:hypothetical protein
MTAAPGSPGLEAAKTSIFDTKEIFQEKTERSTREQRNVVGGTGHRIRVFRRHGSTEQFRWCFCGYDRSMIVLSMALMGWKIRDRG